MNPPEKFYNLKSLRVCVVTQQMSNVISGIGLHARNLVNHLTSDGHQVTVIAPHDQRPPIDLNYQFIGIPSPFLKNNQARWIPLSISYAKCLSVLGEKYDFDIIHFTDARESLFCRLKTPIIGNVNDTYAADIKPILYYRKYYTDWLQRWLYYHLVHWCEARTLPRLTAILANSSYTARIISSQYHLEIDQVHICHKSIELNQYTHANVLHQRSTPHPPKILFVGGNMQRKGLPTLIKAAPLILKELPEAEFWVAGKDQAESKMKTLCERAGVTNNFHFSGWQSQSELVNLYSQADVFTIPSITEAFGVVFLEAMATGVPVIGTEVGGIPEIIQHKENGLLVPPDEPITLAEAIINILQDQALRDSLRDKGLETASKFSVDRMMEITYRVYESVLKNPHS